MCKFATNSVVRYDGPVKALASGVGYSVIDSIPDGMPIGNGEKNNSGQDIVRCKSLYSGVIFNFLESDLVPAN